MNIDDSATLGLGRLVASGTRPDAATPAPWSRIGDAALPWLLPASLLLLWTVGATQGWISPQVLPSPQFVWETLRDLAASGDLWLHASASLARVLIGFAAGAALGLALGAAMGLSRRVEAYLLPTFNALVQIPVLAWLPFVLLLVGIGEPLKYILIAKAAMVPVALNTLQGFRQTPQALREVAKVYGYTRRQQVLEVVLPHATPTLFTGLRLGFTKAWLSLVVVELVASSEGLGYLIVYGRQLFQLDLVMAAVIVVGAIGYAIDRALDALEKAAHRRRPGAAG
ncbi:ABC transporter permease [Variovorax ginsengisoli]|uniref:Sulfonate transport system permease protein n=1 Tax=Variovorax ginsengisoli TaxID=363844 RepID=A0ABT9S304_9BURK|nr:ABC transporter permease [Variovorax ginsengisoli]MDP9898736.1 sulfonate transport system permease protein [Variovorax ginsengisoli]